MVTSDCRNMSARVIENQMLNICGRSWRRHDGATQGPGPSYGLMRLQAQLKFEAPSYGICKFLHFLAFKKICGNFTSKKLSQILPTNGKKRYSGENFRHN